MVVGEPLVHVSCVLPLSTNPQKKKDIILKYHVGPREGRGHLRGDKWGVVVGWVGGGGSKISLPPTSCIQILMCGEDANEKL